MTRGAVYMMTSAMLFAGVGAIVKAAAPALPSEEVVFFRNVMGLLALAPLLWRVGLKGLATQRLGQHFTRGLWGLLAMYCSFISIAHMRLADALLLNYTSPLFIPYVAKMWLREPVPAGVSGALLLGFAGVALILKPGTGMFQPIALLALVTAVFAAFAQVNIRQLTRHEPTVRIVFYFALFSTLISAVPMLRVWRNPSPAMWGLMVLMGAVATSAQLFLTKAYASAPAAEVGPFIYTTVLFGALLDLWLWRKLPDALSVAGTVLVVAAGVVMIRRTAGMEPAEKTPVAA